MRRTKPAGRGTWTKDVFGLQLWVWIAIGASSVVLFGLVVLTVLVQRRNKRMKVRERKKENQLTRKEVAHLMFFFFYLEESEKAEIHAAASYSQRLLPMQQVLPLPLLYYSQSGLRNVCMVFMLL